MGRARRLAAHGALNPTPDVAPGERGEASPPSPRPVAITVARLDESSPWRRYTTDAAGDGWVRLDERLSDPAALDAWYRAELDATARGHADLAGALIVYRLAGALAELVIGVLFDQRRCVELTLGAVSLRFGAAARLDEMSVASPAVAVMADDPAAGEPGTTVVASEGRLRAVAVEGLVAVFAPLTEAVRARAPFGLRGMWGTLADHLAEVAVRRARERRLDVDGAWSAAEILIAELAAREPLLRARPRRQVVTCDAGTGTFVAKGTCCLIYKAADRPGSGPASARRLIESAACTSCPLRSADDRATRFAAYVLRTDGGHHPA